MLPTMVKKTLDQHVLPNLKTTTTISTIFYNWMSCGGVDTFVLIIKKLNEAWVLLRLVHT